MISFQDNETIDYQFIEEVQGLIELHYTEVGQEEFKLDPDWDKYYRAQSAGAMRLFTVRDGNLLIGYCIFMIGGHYHYKGRTIAVQDVIFVHPDYRKSLIGVNFLKFIDDQIMDEGIDHIAHNVKRKNDFGPVLSRLGYEEHATVWVKKLGGKNG